MGLEVSPQLVSGLHLRLAIFGLGGCIHGCFLLTRHIIAKSVHLGLIKDLFSLGYFTFLIPKMFSFFKHRITFAKFNLKIKNQIKLNKLC